MPEMPGPAAGSAKSPNCMCWPPALPVNREPLPRRIPVPAVEPGDPPTAAQRPQLHGLDARRAAVQLRLARVRQAPGRLHTGAGLDEGLAIWHSPDGVDGRAGQVGEVGEGLVADIPSSW
jgi:hypothetical protein